MPSFKIHDKWAERMGIDRKISSEVNRIIDFKYTHDFYKEPKDWLNFSNYVEIAQKALDEICEKYGVDGIKAFFLHAMLDYLSDRLLLDESIEFSTSFRIIQSFRQEFNEVRGFVRRNIKEIEQDIENEPGFKERIKKVYEFVKASHNSFGIEGKFRLHEEEGVREISSVAALQKVRSVIKKGGKCEIWLENEKYTLTTQKELDDFKKKLKGKKISGTLHVVGNDVFMFIE